MHPNSKHWLAGALFVAALVVAGWMLKNQGVAPAPLAAPATPPPAHAGRGAAPTPLPPTPAIAATLLARDTGVTLADQVERLLATKDPKDAYTAYLLVSSCVIVNDTHARTQRRN